MMRSIIYHGVSFTDPTGKGVCFFRSAEPTPADISSPAIDRVIDRLLSDGQRVRLGEPFPDPVVRGRTLRPVGNAEIHSYIDAALFRKTKHGRSYQLHTAGQDELIGISDKDGLLIGLIMPVRLPK